MEELWPIRGKKVTIRQWEDRYMCIESGGDNVDPVLPATVAQPAEASTCRRGQRPRFARNVEELIAAHSLAAKFMSMPIDLTVVVSPDCDTSRTPLNNLNKLCLRDLCLEQTVLGGYLILRTLVAPYGYGKIISVVEDHEGTCAILAVYNRIFQVNHSLHNFLPIGTVLILKEPFCTESVEGDCVLRCESPSDMIFVYEGHELSRFTEGIVWKCDVTDIVLRVPLPSTAFNWKERGHDLFMLGKYRQAIRCYFLGLREAAQEEHNDDLIRSLYLKLSFAFMDQGLFETATKFADNVLESDPHNSSALIVAGRSSYPLKKYEEALGYFDVYNQITQGSVSVDVLVEKCDTRVLEKKNGEHKVDDMFSAPVEHPKIRIDCADYIGPVRIITIEDEGRGVVATGKVTPGTLLIVSKALVYSQKPLVIENLAGNINLDCCQDLLHQLATMLISNPCTLGPIVNSLYDGSKPVKDVPPSCFCDPGTKMEPIVDMKQLKGIVECNLFGIGLSGSGTGFGLFQWPSYFNYSCMPNASIHKFNDVIFIRAIQNINDGEEIFLPCLSPDPLLTSRTKLCSKRGVRCGCLFCRLDDEVPDVVRRERALLLNVYSGIRRVMDKKLVRDIPLVIRDVRELINQLRKAHQDDVPFTLGTTLSAVYPLLAKAYSLSNTVTAEQPDIAIACHKMVLKYYGFNPTEMIEPTLSCTDLIPPDAVLNESVLTAVCRMFVLYTSLGEDQESNIQRWRRVLTNLEYIYSGGSTNVIVFKYAT